MALTLLTFLYNDTAIVLYMFCPGLAAVFTKLTFKQSLKSFAWSVGKPVYLGLSYALPLIYLAPVYIGVWLYFDAFPNSDYLQPMLEAMPGFSEAKTIVVIVVASATIGVLGTAITGALGEELGWRGLLTPKLLELYSFNKTSFLVGVLWFSWHLPLIFYTSYFNGADLYLGLVCHAVLVISLSYLLTWLYQKSNSIWPACILHASHNAYAQQVFFPLTKNTESNQYLIGDFGIGIALSSALVTILFLIWSKTKSPSKPFQRGS